MIKYGIHSYKAWTAAISFKKIKNETLMKLGIPEIYGNELDILNVSMHTPDTEICINQIVPQLTHISKFVGELLGIRDELIQAVSNFSKVDNVSPMAMECALLKEVNVSIT